jgi:hypothetical protein
MRGKQRGRTLGLLRLVARGAVLAAAALACALAVSAGVAYGDVASSDYTIGTPTGPVSSVVASPSKVGEGASVNFEVSFTAGTSLAGSASDWVTIVPSEALGSTPSNIGITGSSCIQAGTNGGSYSATGITINLNSSCSMAAGTKVTVLFTASAPFAIGTLTFSATTSENDTPASSNGVTVTTPGPILTAASHAFGADTTYTISEVPVTGLTSGGNSLTLTAAATVGTETIAFLNSGSGGAGYTVDYTPPGGGTATSDTVTNASASGATVTLTLATALVSGDTVDITASGQNPAASPTSQADHITVAPGNGTFETTNSIDFGGSVSTVNVTPSLPVATASTTYIVSFGATDAVLAGGYIYLTEDEGPTNFSTLTGIEVIDNTQHSEFIATGAILTDGSATIPVADGIDAGDSISVVLANVTNPPAAGSIGDFTVASSGDPVAAEAAPYTLFANATPGVLVTVDPSATGAVATYTLSNILASGAMTAGTGTIKLEAPAGTEFPNSPSDYGITDDTTPSGSGTVVAALSGGGSNLVTFTVPNSIEQGDELTLKIADVLNPTVPSSTDAITLVGSVTNLPPTAPPPPPGPGPTPIATTPIVTTPISPVTTPAPPAAKTATATISLDGTSVTVKGATGTVKLTCTGSTTCSGKLTLTAKTTTAHGKKKRSKTQTIGTASFSVAAGKTANVEIKLNATGQKLLSTGHGHLSTQLEIAKSSPSPSEAQTKTVHCSESRPANKHKRTVDDR